MNAISFGNYLREKRKARGFTLIELGEMSGLSQPYLSQIENGKKGIPSPEVLRNLSKALGESHTELMIRAGHLKSGEVNGYEAKDKDGTIHGVLDFRDITFKEFLSSDGEDKRRIENKYAALLDYKPLGYEHYVELINDDNIASMEWMNELTEDIQRAIDNRYKTANQDYEDYIDNRYKMSAYLDLKNYLTINEISYNNYPLDLQDRQRILGMLAFLFPDMK